MSFFHGGKFFYCWSLDLSSFLLCTFNAIKVPLALLLLYSSNSNKLFLLFQSEGFFLFVCLFVFNFSWNYIWPMCHLEMCYLIFLCLGLFQLSSYNYLVFVQFLVVWQHYFYSFKFAVFYGSQCSLSLWMSHVCL